MDVTMISTIDVSGGKAYENVLKSVLSEHFNLEFKLIKIEKSNTHYGIFYELFRIKPRVKFFYNLLKNREYNDIWILDFMCLAISRNSYPGKKIVIFHHIDNSISAHPMYYWLLEKLYYQNLKRVDAIVTVSEYWKHYLTSRGYKNVRVIYNAFDTRLFKFDKSDVLSFKKKYMLTGKPIIYLGNCQKSKGVVESYHELKNIDAHLVTSGKKQVDIPAVNLDLNYKEYLLLLKAASVVVTMSKFKEGWCRTAHEAMLCKTPVVGSGMGGMKELLEKSGQIVCPKFSDLKRCVEIAMATPSLGEHGFSYASKFTTEKFEHEWIRLINETNFK